MDIAKLPRSSSAKMDPNLNSGDLRKLFVDFYVSMTMCTAPASTVPHDDAFRPKILATANFSQFTG